MKSSLPYNYLIPNVSALPEGHRCLLGPPFATIGAQLSPGVHEVDWRVRVFRNGEELSNWSRRLRFDNGELAGPPPDPFIWDQTVGDNWRPDPCFLESDFVSVADKVIFSSNIQPSFYAIFTAPGRKSFFSDSGVKFGLAIVVNQVRAYGKYADCYLPVSIDRDADYDESIVMINPYQKDIISRILFSDGRSLDRIRINGGSARFIRLSDILGADENSWSGSIQITANNRIITFSVKHSLANPEIIHDYEHLDAYRAERTHLPLFRKLRQFYGAYRANLV